MEDLNKVIEKIIKIRIEDIIEKGKINDETGNKIKDINEHIIKNNKFKIKNKSHKKSIPKDERVLKPRTLCIKDMSRVIKNEPHLCYLSDDIIKKINNYKDKPQSEKLKLYNNIWKELNAKIKDKYEKLCENKDLTNGKYNKIVN